ncbi:hypothetical protein DBR06_SOUSAS11910036, partial [Sousa chinensis]
GDRSLGLSRMNYHYRLQFLMSLRVHSTSRGLKMFTGVLFLNKASELWKPSWGSAPSQRFRASLVAEGLKFGILLLEKCCWDSWDAQ